MWNPRLGSQCLRGPCPQRLWHWSAQQCKGHHGHMKALLLVVASLLALNPRVIFVTTGARPPQGVISCSTGISIQWGKLLPEQLTGMRGVGLLGIYTADSAAEAVTAKTVSDLPDAAMFRGDLKGRIKAALMKPCA